MMMMMMMMMMMSNLLKSKGDDSSAEPIYYLVMYVYSYLYAFTNVYILYQNLMNNDKIRTGQIGRHVSARTHFTL